VWAVDTTRYVQHEDGSGKQDGDQHAPPHVHVVCFLLVARAPTVTAQTTAAEAEADEWHEDDEQKANDYSDQVAHKLLRNL